MALSPRVRFEVFKRDEFTCQYCNRKTPQVVLEVDHVIPRAEGGGDEYENLVTSCWECNRGKGATLLDRTAPVADIHEQTVLLLERELQLKEYAEVRRQQRLREDKDISALIVYWDDLANGSARQLPSEAVLRRWLKIFATADIMDAMEIAMDRAGDWRGVKYTSGILRNWARDRGLLSDEDAEDS